jgi:hypothetical protein
MHMHILFLNIFLKHVLRNNTYTPLLVKHFGELKS